MDTLTGLNDRADFLRTLGTELKQRYRDSVLAVLVVNINRFRSINTVHGYHAADKVLQVTANRLRSIICKQDIA